MSSKPNNLKERLQGSLDGADKQALKAGAKTCWSQFTKFVDKFTELIFSKSFISFYWI